MTDTLGRTVVFNGEIYNHQQLRRELEAKGHAFRTACDTEVLLAGYAEWGEGLPARLSGMYAMVIWDPDTGECFAARDRFGIKPLYWQRRGSERGGWFLFASELKAFEREDEPSTVDPILRFPPGWSMMTGGAGGGALPALPRAGSWGGTPEQAVGRFRELFRGAVRRMLDTELPVAVFCSGGIDSSALLYEAVSASRDRGGIPHVTAYCVGLGASGAAAASATDGCDAAFAARLTAELDVPFRLETIEPERMVESVPNTIETIESFEPNHIRAGTANRTLARRVARDGIKVALVGEGADEMLGGYQEFPACLRKRGGNGPELGALFERFVSELHLTQLQRVDRVTMAVGVEARVPYLDEELAAFVWSLPVSMKLRASVNDEVTTKWVLREAYRGLLPADIVWRRKVPMGEGAGIGDNGPRGPFYEASLCLATEGDLTRLREAYPRFQLRNREEAWYFGHFLRRFGPVALAADRPYTNVLATR